MFTVGTTGTLGHKRMVSVVAKKTTAACPLVAGHGDLPLPRALLAGRLPGSRTVTTAV
jgi:hypothetical protein